MMGPRHALTGVLGVTTLAAYAQLTPVQLGTFALVLPGAVLLPDLDHERSTASGTYGPLTRTFSLVLHHRRESHSVPGIAVLGVLTEIAVRYRDHPVAAGYLVVLLVLTWASFIRLFKIKGWLDDLLPIPVALAVVLGGVDLSALPAAVMTGCFIHVLGDMITKQGCPLFWPFSSTRYKLARFKAGGWWERWPITVLIVAAITWTSGVWLVGLTGASLGAWIGP